MIYASKYLLKGESIEETAADGHAERHFADVRFIARQFHMSDTQDVCRIPESEPGLHPISTQIMWKLRCCHILKLWEQHTYQHKSTPL